MSPGPVMIDLEGTQLSAEEKELIRHPLVGGLIYFTRNFESREQITRLTREIKQVKDILVCVDHEGGRVQRFRQDFTRLPPCRKLGHQFDRDNATALQDAKELGWLMAAELRAADIDFSFAPVVDLDYGSSEVIGDRAFHSDPDHVATLVAAYVDGMKEAGMANTGKHFPGHGAVAEDSHLELPVDKRAYSEIEAADLKPFKELFARSKLDAIMPAHVIYEQIDAMPAGFSEKWIKTILRAQMGFDGVVFSDDLNMAAAHMAGSFEERAYAALNAGCDMVLVCNNRAGAIEVLDKLKWKSEARSSARLQTMRGQKSVSWNELQNMPRWQSARQLAADYLDH